MADEPDDPRAGEPDTSEPDTSEPVPGHAAHARLLKGAAVLAVGLGLAIVAWLIDKAVRYPEVQATQLGSVAPFWVPFAIFIAICVALIARLFWRAARRVEDGEDLFVQRHRRRPGEDSTASDEP
jgi:type VI protein secretion system component VasK